MNKFLHLVRLGWAYKIAGSTRLSYPPYQYTIEPTNRCNLHCTFCPQSDPDHFTFRPAGDLTFKNFEIFLQQVKKAAPGNKNINLTLDGEPLNNKDFVRMVELSAAAGFFTVFASNGTLLNKEKIDQLITAGPFLASIDFASDEKIYETIRGRTGDFALVKENLTYLMEASKSEEKVHLNVHDITPFTGVAPNASLAKMKVLFPGRWPSRIRFDSRQFHNFCGHLQTEKKNDHYRLCPYPWMQMAVTYSGDCVACCRDTVARSVLGNVFTTSIMDIWNGDAYRQFRQNLLNKRPDLNAACAQCDLPYSGNEERWKIKYTWRSLLKR